MTLKDVAVGVLLIGGVGLELVCVLGLVVMRDTFDRLHYVGPTSFGVLLIAAAIVVQDSFSLIGNKALATAALLLVSSPVLVHVTARTVRIREHGDWNAQPGEGIEAED